MKKGSASFLDVIAATGKKSRADGKDGVGIKDFMKTQSAFKKKEKEREEKELEEERKKRSRDRERERGGLRFKDQASTRDLDEKDKKKKITSMEKLLDDQIKELEELKKELQKDAAEIKKDFQKFINEFKKHYDKFGDLRKLIRNTFKHQVVYPVKAMQKFTGRTTIVSKDDAIEAEKNLRIKNR